MKSIVYIGLDVHKDTFSGCGLDGETGEILKEAKFGSDPKLVEKFIDSVLDEFDKDVEIVCGYEAGVLGYSLYKSLQKRGIPCVIMAPSTMYSSAKNKVVKNDKMDAKMIARNLAANTYRSVYVPDDEDDDVKEYIRMRKAFKKALTRARQQANAFLLRHGFVYQDTKSKWNPTHLAWIKALHVSEKQRVVIDEWLVEIHELVDKVERFDETIEEFAHSKRYEESIRALTCFKGISTITAMTIHVEIADFERFPNAAAFMSYAGLVSSEHSSGNHEFKGSITKQGNSVVRTALVESAQTLVRGHIGYKSKNLKARQKGQEPDVIGYADRGTIYLQRHFRKLIEHGKPYNKAVAAIARQLAGFVWGMETGSIGY